MFQPEDERRQPLPSEDTGDLNETPPSGETDDPLVASEEGVPYVPPSDRVMSEARYGEAGPDAAGTAPTDAGELEREDDVQVGTATAGGPTDDALRADVVERLRDSNVTAGDRLGVSVIGRTVTLTGTVESIDVLEEVLGIVGEVPGVQQVSDEVEIEGV